MPQLIQTHSKVPPGICQGSLFPKLGPGKKSLKAAVSVSQMKSTEVTYAVKVRACLSLLPLHSSAESCCCLLNLCLAACMWGKDKVLWRANEDRSWWVDQIWTWRELSLTWGGNGKSSTQVGAVAGKDMGTTLLQ